MSYLIQILCGRQVTPCINKYLINRMILKLSSKVNGVVAHGDQSWKGAKLIGNVSKMTAGFWRKLVETDLTHSRLKRASQLDSRVLPNQTY